MQCQDGGGRCPFQEVCKLCLINDANAKGEFSRTYNRVVRHYYEEFGGRNHKDDYGKFVRGVWADGAARGHPVHDTAWRAAESMAAQRQFEP